MFGICHFNVGYMHLKKKNCSRGSLPEANAIWGSLAWQSLGTPGVGDTSIG